eukprot:3148265-Karenia_brevis.AAC.1
MMMMMMILWMMMMLLIMVCAILEPSGSKMPRFVTSLCGPWPLALAGVCGERWPPPYDEQSYD